MRDNKITITIKDGQVTTHNKVPIPIFDTIEVFLKVTLAAMNQVVSNASEEARPKVKEDLYELFNIAASNTLAIFAPEIEMRPDLTVQAILEKENEIIMQGRAPALTIPKEDNHDSKSL